MPFYTYCTKITALPALLCGLCGLQKQPAFMEIKIRPLFLLLCWLLIKGDIDENTRFYFDSDNSFTTIRCSAQSGLTVIFYLRKGFYAI